MVFFKALEKRVVFSIDYDGCVGNDCDSQLPWHDLMLKQHKLFWSYFRHCVKDAGAENCTLYIGSARQSFAADEYTRSKNNSTSCYDLYPNVADVFDIKFDNFLLADLDGRQDVLADGTAYHRATNPGYTGTHTDWYHDTSKITLLYAQMHREALKYPNAEIEFNFYDDRDDILTALHTFFDENKSLLPPYITLKLHQYMGEVVENDGKKHTRLRSKIPITADNTTLGVDILYKGNVRNIGKYIDVQRSEAGTSIDIDEIMALNLGERFYNLRKLPLHPIIEYPESESIPNYKR